jgi:UDP-glucose 4-epimerase
MDTVLVTGGGGFIGSHLVDRLLAAGYGVRVLDNFSTGNREHVVRLGDDVELVEGDIRSYERVLTGVRGCRYVLHQAALPSVPRSVQDPLTSHEVNATGTLNVLLAARDSDVERVVFASSSSVYGANPEVPKRETMATRPISPYAAAKQAAESYCRSFSQVYGLDTVALRYFNVFGPRQDPLSQYAAVIPNFATAFLAGEAPVVHGDGTQTRDFTYIENVVQANMLAMLTAGVGGESFNIAYGRRVSLLDMVSELQALTGSSVEPRHVDPRPGDVKHSLAALDHARERLGYEPEVDFREGLRRTVEDLRARTDGAAIPAGSA